MVWLHCREMLNFLTGHLVWVYWCILLSSAVTVCCHRWWLDSDVIHRELLQLLGEETPQKVIIIKLLQWFKMLHDAHKCRLARATFAPPPCPCLSVKLCSFGLLFSLHVFVFDTGANCKCVLQIDNPGQAQSLQFNTEGTIDRVQRLVLHNSAWGKIQTSAVLFYFNWTQSVSLSRLQICSCCGFTHTLTLIK